MNNSVAFSTLARLCHQLLYLVMEHLRQLLPNFPPVPFGIAEAFSVSVGLPFLDVSYKWLYTQYVTFVCGFFHLTVFLRLIHSVVWLRMSFFLWLNSTLSSGCSTVCSSSPKSWASRLSLPCGYGSRAAVNICVGASPGRPVAETPRFHCRESGFCPWSGSQDPTCHTVWPQKNK